MLDGNFTEQANLEVYRTDYGVSKERVEEVLRIVNLTDTGSKTSKKFSLGMKQRLGIAAALLGDPDLLILDEPSNGLDPQGVREVRALIGSLAGTGRTVLVSSHDLSELEQVCDWLVLIDTGRSLYQGPTREFLDTAAGGLSVAPQHAHQLEPLLDLLTERGLRTQRHEHHLVVSTDDADTDELAASVNRAAFAAGIVLVELSVVRSTLEDRYLTLVEAGAR